MSSTGIFFILAAVFTSTQALASEADRIMSKKAGQMIQKHCSMISPSDIDEGIRFFEELESKDTKKKGEVKDACDAAADILTEASKELERTAVRSEDHNQGELEVTRPEELENELIRQDLDLQQKMVAVRTQCKEETSKVKKAVIWAMRANQVAAMVGVPYSGYVNMVYGAAKDGYSAYHAAREGRFGKGETVSLARRGIKLSRKGLKGNLRNYTYGVDAFFFVKDIINGKNPFGRIARIFGSDENKKKHQLMDKFTACTANIMARQAREGVCQKITAVSLRVPDEDGQSLNLGEYLESRSPEGGRQLREASADFDENRQLYREAIMLLDGNRSDYDSDEFCQQTSCLWNNAQAADLRQMGIGNDLARLGVQQNRVGNLGWNPLVSSINDDDWKRTQSRLVSEGILDPAELGKREKNISEKLTKWGNKCFKRQTQDCQVQCFPPEAAPFRAQIVEAINGGAPSALAAGQKIFFAAQIRSGFDAIGVKTFDKTLKHLADPRTGTFQVCQKQEHFIGEFAGERTL
jgi:hypothetical protein